MAQAVARREARRRELEEVRVRSAGTFATGGSPASGGALRTAQRHGVDLSEHRSSPLTAELLEWADLVVGMTRTHVNIARRLGDEELPVVLLSELLPRGHPAHGQEVEDPVGGTDDAYERAYQVIGDAVQRLFESIGAGGEAPDATDHESGNEGARE